MRRLVLWDIDGTLVDAAPVGRGVFAEAFEAVLGYPAREVVATMVAMAGRTDPEIALEFLAAHQVSGGDELLSAFGEALVAAWATRAAMLAEHGHALPGA